MRLVWGILALLGGWATGEAAASSIVQVAPPEDALSRSVISRGEATPGRSAAPSILAFEEPVPPVTFEKVAAVPAPVHSDATPIVIRGGLVDGIPGASAQQVTLPDGAGSR